MSLVDFISDSSVTAKASRRFYLVTYGQVNKETFPIFGSFTTSVT